MAIQSSKKKRQLQPKLAAQPENPVTDDDEEDITERMESSRPTRERRQPDKLTFFQSTKNEEWHKLEQGHQLIAQVKEEDERWHKLEQCHNLVAQAHPNPDQDR
jgi:hypothetical protein